MYSGMDATNTRPVFTLTSDGTHGCLVGYPTFEVTEEQMTMVFGSPNSEETP